MLLHGELSLTDNVNLFAKSDPTKCIRSGCNLLLNDAVLEDFLSPILVQAIKRLEFDILNFINKLTIH